MFKFFKKFIKVLLQKITSRDSPTIRTIFYAILVILFLWLVSKYGDFLLQNVLDYWKQPQVLVVTSIGQHIVGKQGMSGGVDQKAYLAKITENNYYLIFELKNDNRVIPTIFFVFDTDTYCPKCYYHTTTFKNIGKYSAKDIVFDADTFTNKIKLYQPDRRIKVSDNFGSYGQGGIRFMIDDLDINEIAQVAYRIDEPKEIVTPKCFINKKLKCIQTSYYYQVMPWDKNGVTFNNSITINFPENLKEGFYEINLRNKTLIPIPVTIISEKFGIKHFG